ncbi:MAG: hypothetical protein HOV80_00435 [Polyangiaceae bacterium]|nr:hypothetical protein [Polyangiaceae bacterium]
MSKNPFIRDNEVDEPGIVGARWWNRSVVESSATTGRRVALGILAFSVVGVVGLCGVAAVGASRVVADDEDSKEESKASLKLQQDLGWNFDVPTQTVAFDAAYTKEYARSALATLVSDLTPSRSELAPYYVPTLFQSPEALPNIKLPDGSNENIRPIAEALRPIRTPSMIEAEARGRAFGRVMAAAPEPVLAIVDIEGPDAVAFAAGAAEKMDPVFVFDNWPHPYGVVKAHLTLAAAVYHQPAFAAAKTARAVNAPPLFVLDRGRLATYTDSPTQFDNRYVAKLPAGDWIRAQLSAVKRVLYVPPSGADPVESADLRPIFADYRTQGLDVRAVADASFFRGAGGDETYYFGGSPEREEAFYWHYGWGPNSAKSDTTNPASNERAKSWTPPKIVSPEPSLATIGLTTVAVGLATGYVLGRSGSWNRAPSGGWGGG